MLYDNPPHRISLYSVSNANAASGGATQTPALVQAACPCLINTTSSNTQLVYAQQGVKVAVTVGILSSDLTSTPQPGWKIIADDTGKTAEVMGIRSGRESALGTIPPLTYLDCTEWL